MKKQGKIAIFIVTYNAVNFIDSVLDRIPENIKKKVKEIYVFDDASKDNTYYAAIGYKTIKKFKKLHIFKNRVNLGYGGNQKAGYKYAIKKGYDIVVLLHGDGQYAPEELSKLLKPLEEDKVDMVFGSRMRGRPLKGGMPLHKFIGNKILTLIENLFLGLNLSEYHSGYRLYNCHALKQVPFDRCSNDFHFDTDILIQFKIKKLKIAEIPIPTHYGKEISYVNIFKYGSSILWSVVSYKLHQLKIRKEYKFDFN